MTVQAIPQPVQYESKATIPPLAKAIAEWFPELGGRSVPVSEAKIKRDNIPTLPLCMVSLLREVGNNFVATNRTQPEEDIIVEFWFEPERYKTSTNGETPFWAFYDYDTLRDRLLTHLRSWRSPRGERLEYFGLDIESDQFATVIIFSLRHKFTFCPIEDCVEVGGDGTPITANTFEFKMCAPISRCEGLDEPESPSDLCKAIEA